MGIISMVIKRERLLSMVRVAMIAEPVAQPPAREQNLLARAVHNGAAFDAQEAVHAASVELFTNRHFVSPLRIDLFLMFFHLLRSARRASASAKVPISSGRA